MGIEIVIEGTAIEYNNILALRPNKTPNRRASECLPNIMEEGNFHNFFKKGYRIYPLCREIPLAETEGDEKLSDTKAYIEIIGQSQFVSGGSVFTKGDYIIKKIIKREK